MGEVVKCPYCGFGEKFKMLRMWKYKWWNVYFYECTNCNGRFRYQVDPSGKYNSYIIRVGVRRSKK
jgi:DNA-directed RNA polymerase subunit RPC12/RpoP